MMLVLTVGIIGVFLAGFSFMNFLDSKSTIPFIYCVLELIAGCYFIIAAIGHLD